MPWKISEGKRTCSNQLLPLAMGLVMANRICRKKCLIQVRSLSYELPNFYSMFFLFIGIVNVKSILPANGLHDGEAQAR